MSSIRCPLNETAHINQNEPACIDRNRVYFYPQLETAAEQLAARLEEQGVGEGDVVMVSAAMQWRWIPLWFACLRRKAVLAPVSPRLPASRKAEVQDILTPRLCIDEDDGVALDSLCDTGSIQVEGGIRLDLSQRATILQSSGSSGVGKLFAHTVAAHYYAGLGANRHLPLSSRDRWLLSLPLYHAGGLGTLFRCVMAGASMAIPDPREDLGEEVLLYSATHLSLVPTQLRRLLRHPDSAEIARQLKLILLGGAPCPDDLLAAALEKGFPVHQTYGMTETLGQVCTVPRHPTPEQRKNSGTLLPYRRLRISGDGEIQLRGEVLFEEWIGKEQPLDEDGWFSTGDLGTFDDDHGLSVLGRKDNQFVSGGENIVPEEIEAVLLRMVDCTEAVVVEAPHEDFGLQPVAFLDVPADDLVTETLVDLLREELPGFKVPRVFLSLPEQEGLKPSRRELRRLAAAHCGG